MIPYLEAVDGIPKEVLSEVEKKNKIFIAINVIVPMIEGSMYFGYVIFSQSSIFSWADLAAQFLVGLLQMVSGGFLGYGIYKIRQQATEDEQLQINVTQMILHVLAFTLYLVTSLITFTFLLLFQVFQIIEESTLILSISVSIGISFIAQLFLICILWPLAQQNPFAEDDVEFAQQS